MRDIKRAYWSTEMLQFVSGVTNSAERASHSYGGDAGDSVLVVSSDLKYCAPKARPVTSYDELHELVAVLASLNPQYELYFRGQRNTYGRDGVAGGPGHSLMPSIFRRPDCLRRSVEVLKECGNLLLQDYEDYSAKNFETLRRFRESQLARWAVLQHYELCDTPLLDLTRTLQVACSFALPPFDGTTEEVSGYVYVLGLPFQKEKVLSDTTEGIINMSLLGITPSNAKRPLVQDGYLACDRDWWRLLDLDSFFALAGSDPDVLDLRSFDFSSRILAVFNIRDRLLLEEAYDSKDGEANSASEGNDDAPVTSEFWRGSGHHYLRTREDLCPEDPFVTGFLANSRVREYAEGQKT